MANANGMDCSTYMNESFWTTGWRSRGRVQDLHEQPGLGPN